MTYSGIAIFFVVVVLYAIFANRLARFSITMPMVFVLVGVFTSARFLNLISLPIQAKDIELLTEITLALLLFADATTLSYLKLQQDTRLPGRLLLIGMPLTILFGAVVAFIFFHEQGIWFAFLIAAILTPTDAALGLPIFNNPKVPVRIRRALNVESGINDGIATPFVTVFLILAVAESTPSLAEAPVLALKQVGIALGVGTLVGFGGGRLFNWAADRRWSSSTGEQVGSVALALAAFEASTALGGNGFIAAFIGGLFFGYFSRGRHHASVEFSETLGVLLSLFVWTVFGSSLGAELLFSFNPKALLYGLLSITLIRMLPVAISMIGEHFRWDTLGIMGWFGPRGLASVVFTLLAFETFQEFGHDYSLLFQMAGWTIFLSVILHSLTALPLANWYSRRVQAAAPDSPELVEVGEIKAPRSRRITSSDQ
jgi:NhaP-type Na+/H+ or K+/H+ antiporter